MTLYSAELTLKIKCNIKCEYRSPKECEINLVSQINIRPNSNTFVAVAHSPTPSMVRIADFQGDTKKSAGGVGQSDARGK